MTFAILRYPGGKGRFASILEENVRISGSKILVEPFAGGAAAGLTLLNKNIIDKLILIELDDRVAAFWKKIRDDASFSKEIVEFNLAKKVNSGDLDVLAERKLKLQAYLDSIRHTNTGFWTLIQNRCAFGGYLNGNLLLKGFGRNPFKQEGKKKYEMYEGIGSQWNGPNLAKKVSQVHRWFKEGRIEFYEGNALSILPKFSKEFAFVDPPYSYGKNAPGKSLYEKHEVDHRALFDMLSKRVGPWIATYDNSSATANLIADFNFQWRAVRMSRLHADADESIKKEENKYHELMICPQGQILLGGTMGDQLKCARKDCASVFTPRGRQKYCDAHKIKIVKTSIQSSSNRPFLILLTSDQKDSLIGNGKCEITLEQIQNISQDHASS